MPERRLTSLTNNKRKLLENAGYKSIKAYRKDFPFFNTDESAYKYLLGEYNDVIDMLNQQERLRKEEEKRRQREADKIARQKAKKEAERKRLKIINIEPSLSALKTELRKHIGESVVVEYLKGKKLYRTKQYTIPTNFSTWWGKKKDNVKLDFQYDSDEMIWDRFPDGHLYLYKQTEIPLQNKIRQSFREGITNCLLTPVRDWIITKVDEAKTERTQQRYNKMIKDVDNMLIQYRNGVPENEVSLVCDKLQIDIAITTPFSKTTLLEAKSTKKALRKFRYMNTRLNHIDLNELVNDDNIIEVASQKELVELREDFEYRGVYYTYNKNKNGLCSISTLVAKYQLNSDYMKAVNEFEDKYGLKHYKIDDIHDKDLSTFVRNGTHYNGTIDFNPELAQSFKGKKVPAYIKHIDLAKAYTQFKSCSYYNGFLGKITDFRKTDKVEGVGMYLITDLVFEDNAFKALNDKMVMYVNNNIYTDAELKMLNDNGVCYKIVGGCWGVDAVEMEFTDEMINTKCDDDDVPFYSKWTGACNSQNFTKSFWIKGSEEMSQIIAENCEGIVRRYWNNEIQIEYNKPYAKHLSHFTSFILAYMRMNMIEQLLTMNINTLVRICCDGIYFTGDEVNISNIFSYKAKKTFGNDEGLQYCSQLENKDEFNFGNAREHNKKELHLGEGGSGKTHYNLNDNGFIRPMFLAPSWKLARAKERETGIKCSVWARALSEDPEKINFIKQSANVLIWDEVSMMTENQKKFIFKHYANMKNILCGDLGYQLPCIDGEPLESTGFDAIIHHNQDHRCKCPILKSIKMALRVMIKNNRNKWEINAWCVAKFNKLRRVINADKLKELYDIDAMILVGTNELKNKYTEMFRGKFGKEKYYITSNNRLYSNGEITIADNKPDKTDCEIRHAFTTHSIQGETAQHKLFIDSSRMFDSRMFYTAISRAKTIEQIYIIM